MLPGRLESIHLLTVKTLQKITSCSLQNFALLDTSRAYTHAGRASIHLCMDTL